MPSITKSHGSANIVGRTDSVKYIVCHYTAGGGPNGGALANLNYFKDGSGGRSASAHYILDNDHIYEYADPGSKCCWHCGDGKGKYGITNQNSVGIEVALTGNVPYSEKEIQNLTWLVQRLMSQFHVPADHVVRHYDASRKACPLYYTPQGAGGNAAWQKLHSQLTNGSSAIMSSSEDGSASSGYGDIDRTTGETIFYVTDPAIAYAIGIQGKILFDQEEVYPYVITINEQSEDLDPDKLKENDVVGVCIDMGSYFTASHTVNTTFRNSKLGTQYHKYYDKNMAVGLYTQVRARNKEEVLAELKEIRLAVLKYPPNMGLWLIPNFVSNSKHVNNELIDEYYKVLYKLGFNDQVGFYCKKDQMEKFDWESYMDTWYWWMDRHISDVSKIHNMPTPKFFMYDNPRDEDALIEPNFSYSLSSIAGFGYGSLAAGIGRASSNIGQYVADTARVCGGPNRIGFGIHTRNPWARPTQSGYLQTFAQVFDRTVKAMHGNAAYGSCAQAAAAIIACTIDRSMGNQHSTANPSHTYAAMAHLPQFFKNMGILDPNSYQPGDILAKSTHIAIYIEKSGSNFVTFNAHCPNNYSGYYPANEVNSYGEVKGRGFTVFRPYAQGNPINCDSITGCHLKPSSTDVTGTGGRNSYMSSKSQAIVNAAKRTAPTGYMHCLSWVRNVMKNAGVYTSDNYTEARFAYDGIVTSTNRKDLQPGMVVACWVTRSMGHIGVYMGNGMVRHQLHSVIEEDLDTWSKNYAKYKPMGWGWWR